MDPITIWAIFKAVAWGVGILGVGWLTYKLIKYTFPEFTAKVTTWAKQKLLKTRILSLPNAEATLKRTQEELLAHINTSTNVVDRTELLKNLSGVHESMDLVTKLRREGALLLVTREDANGNVVENEKIGIDDPKAQELLRARVTGDSVVTEIPIVG